MPKLSLKNSVLLTSLILAACSPLEDEKTSADKLIINKDSADLAGYLTLMNSPVTVEELSNVSTKGLLKASPKLPPETTLTLISEVAPPQYDGQILQATEVHLNGSRAYVSYNVAGEIHMGALDIIKINDANNPELASRIIFTDTDINAVERKGSSLYLAAATSDTAFESPAVLKVVQLNEAFVVAEESAITNLDLLSYAATDVDIIGSVAYASSGADGGALTLFNTSTLNVIETIPLEDVRGVSSWRGSGDHGVSVITGGTNARLMFYSEDNPTTAASEIGINGASIDFAKATVERHKSLTLLGAGDGGMQVFCNGSSSVDGSLSAPTGVTDSDGNILADEKTVTNAASASGRFVYMANGEAGVYMALMDNSFDSTTCDTTGLEMVGKLQLGDDISVNHVTAKNDLLFVASGIGGLKIIRVSDSSISLEDEDTE